MVFQSYALYPHKTVRENIGYPLWIRKVSGAEHRGESQRGRDVLEIEHLLDRRPRQLSGGQRQRVALARAIVRDPAAFLMDEPLSNLDARLRLSMRGEIKRLCHRLGATTLYVTHDQAEALTMADLIAVMNAGELQQVGVAGRDLRAAGEPVRRHLRRQSPHERAQGRARRTRTARRRRRCPRSSRRACAACAAGDVTEIGMRPEDLEPRRPGHSRARCRAKSTSSSRWATRRWSTSRVGGERLTVRAGRGFATRVGLDGRREIRPGRRLLLRCDRRHRRPPGRKQEGGTMSWN